MGLFSKPPTVADIPANIRPLLAPTLDERLVGRGAIGTAVAALKAPILAMVPPDEQLRLIVPCFWLYTHGRADYAGLALFTSRAVIRSQGPGATSIQGPPRLLLSNIGTLEQRVHPNGHFVLNIFSLDAKPHETVKLYLPTPTSINYVADFLESLRRQTTG